MGKGKREMVKEPKKNKNKRMSNVEIESKRKIVKRTFFTVIALVIIFIIAMIANNYIILDKNETTNLIINNKNVTSDLRNDIIIEDDIIYLSEADVSNFFDKHIYYDEESNKIITTYEKKIAEIGFDENLININGSDKEIYAHAIERDGEVYLPVSEMADVYDVPPYI